MYASDSSKKKKNVCKRKMSWIKDGISSLQYLISCSWAKLSKRCLRALFSMFRIRFCWLRNSSSAEASDPSACEVKHREIRFELFTTAQSPLI